MKKFVFIVFNFLVIIIVGAFFVAPVFASLRAARANEAMYEKNLREVSISATKKNTLSIQREEILPALSEILKLSESFEVEEKNFSASEISVRSFENNTRVHELRVRADFSGETTELLAFLYEISAEQIFFHSFSLDAAEKILRVDFSLFGRE